MTRACPACGERVDPLRAGHVAIFDERFHYFCAVSCREAWLSGARVSPAPEPRRSERASPPPSATPVPVFVEPTELAPPPEPASSAVAEPVELVDAGGTLVGLGLAAGVLAVALALAGSSRVIEAVRIVAAFAGWIPLAARALTTERDPTDPHPAIALGPSLLAIAVASYAFVRSDGAREEAATFAGLVVAATAAGQHLVDRGRRAVREERGRIAALLSCLARATFRAEAGAIAASDVRPGEVVLVDPGDTVPVDGTVVAGEATVVPWPSAPGSATKREGDTVVAGARVVAGSLRVTATFSGLDRVFARLTLDPSRRADVHARIARLSRVVAERGAFAAAGLAALAAFANDESPVALALAALAGFSAIGTAPVCASAATHVARGVLGALRRGVSYRSAGDWDRAAEVSTAAFCARGTLLLGEPELSDLEAVGSIDVARVLALAAGAESTTDHPVALAMKRAAGARGIVPDAVRSPSVQPGLGVTAVSSLGEPLVVGSRALMLREKISIAIAERTLGDIEAHGRTVLLVALSGKLVGVLGLQDGLRPGARAAVQHLLDAQVEPVLLSGESRETCEALGRALDIEHVRPEILPADRAREIERLAEGGMTVAVLGHPRSDEAALGAADVGVALASAGASPGDFAVSLASDDVRDGALAISLAHRTRGDARTGLVLAFAPGVVGALAVAFGLVPPAYAPLASLLGALAATLHARANDLAAAPVGRMPAAVASAR